MTTTNGPEGVPSADAFRAVMAPLDEAIRSAYEQIRAALLPGFERIFARLFDPQPAPKRKPLIHNGKKPRK